MIVSARCPFESRDAPIGRGPWTRGSVHHEGVEQTCSHLYATSKRTRCSRLRLRSVDVRMGESRRDLCNVGSGRESRDGAGDGLRPAVLVHACDADVRTRARSPRVRERGSASGRVVPNDPSRTHPTCFQPEVQDVLDSLLSAGKTWSRSPDHPERPQDLINSVGRAFESSAEPYGASVACAMVQSGR